MDAITALHTRVSIGRLEAPAPSTKERDAMFKAALRAADHGNLRPWRFLTVEDDRLNALGKVFLEAGRILEKEKVEGVVKELSVAQEDKYLKMPTRAPLIVVAISQNVDHPKVPVVEQEMATAAAVQNMITAAHALGVGAYWRTGAMAESSVVKKRLGIAERETIVGFIYLGTPSVAPKKTPELNVDEFVRSW